MVFSYTTIKVADHDFRIVVSCHDEKYIGQYKCECGAYIKKEQNLKKHVETPSHKKRLEWIKQKFPPYLGSLLTKKN